MKNDREKDEFGLQGLYLNWCTYIMLIVYKYVYVLRITIIYIRNFCANQTNKQQNEPI